MYVYCTYTRILYVYVRINAPSNFAYKNTLKYMYTCKYVQYTSHIHTVYDIDTYIIRHTYIHCHTNTSVDICRYMYVYTGICQ